VEIDISQTLLTDDDQCEPLAGLRHADVEAAVIKQDMQTTNDDLVGQLTAENVRHHQLNIPTCIYL